MEVKDENPLKQGLGLLSSSSCPRSTSSEEDLEILYAKFRYHFKLRNEGRDSSETTVFGNGSGAYECQSPEIEDDLELALKEFQEIGDGENIMKLIDEECCRRGKEEWGSDSEGDDASEIVQEIYPTRPNALDCPYYMKTGKCCYNLICRFNHPSDRRNAKFTELEKTMEDNELVEVHDKFKPEVECKNYQSSAGCKYGNLCKFSHSKEQTGSEIFELNFKGLPIRHGEKECPYYMRTGSCKFLEKCRFHHPNPAKAGGNGLQSVALPPNNGNAPRSQCLQRSTQWNEYQNYHSSAGCKYISDCKFSNQQSTGSEIFELNFKGLPIRHGEKECPYYMRNGFCKFLVNCRFHHPNPTNGPQSDTLPTYIRHAPRPQNLQLSTRWKYQCQTALPKNGNEPSNYRRPILKNGFPQKPGEPDCSHYMKTGNCKFTSCKFHHPIYREPHLDSSQCLLSHLGLPLRPGCFICPYYSSKGICKYGPTCRYDHPTSTMPH